MFALIGHGILNSLSPRLFQLAFGDDESVAGYELIDTGSLQQVLQMVSQRNLTGFQVTMPYKRDMVHHLTQPDHRVDMIGAVNTILITDAGWLGTNTDPDGVRFALERLLTPGVTLQHWRLLGAGGAARAAAWTVQRLFPNAEVQVLARRAEQRAEMEHWLRSLNVRISCSMIRPDLVINATPISGKLWEAQLDDTADSFWLDMIYPEQRQRRAPFLDGRAMLVGQAVAAWEFWGLSRLRPEPLYRKLLMEAKDSE